MIQEKGELYPTQFYTGQIEERSSHEHNSHMAGTDDVNTTLEALAPSYEISVVSDDCVFDVGSWKSLQKSQKQNQ